MRISLFFVTIMVWVFDGIFVFNIIMSIYTMHKAFITRYNRPSLDMVHKNIDPNSIAL